MSEELSHEELESHTAEPLPEREEMALVNANLLAPVNAAVAANVITEDSVAYANAEQTVIAEQSI